MLSLLIPFLLGAFSESQSCVHRWMFPEFPTTHLQSQSQDLGSWAAPMGKEDNSLSTWSHLLGVTHLLGMHGPSWTHYHSQAPAHCPVHSKIQSTSCH